MRVAKLVSIEGVLNRRIGGFADGMKSIAMFERDIKVIIEIA